MIRFSIFLLVLRFAAIAAVERTTGFGVRGFSRTAQAHFPGKRVEALMAMVERESFEFTL